MKSIALCLLLDSHVFCATNPFFSSQVPAIVERARGGHYQVACGMAFKATEAIDNQDDELVVTHPSDYFLKSREIRKERANAAVKQESQASGFTQPMDTTA